LPRPLPNVMVIAAPTCIGLPSMEASFSCSSVMRGQRSRLLLLERSPSSVAPICRPSGVSSARTAAPRVIKGPAPRKM
jgi:hypothetical protein